MPEKGFAPYDLLGVTIRPEDIFVTKSAMITRVYVKNFGDYEFAQFVNIISQLLHAAYPITKKKFRNMGVYDYSELKKEYREDYLTLHEYLKRD